jgi:hypothetical protein
MTVWRNNSRLPLRKTEMEREPRCECEALGKRTVLVWCVLLGSGLRFASVQFTANMAKGRRFDLETHE